MSSYSDDTLLNRHTAAVSLDPANKQRDDEMPPRTVIPSRYLSR
ncbi:MULTISPECIES: hypothetical protein [unclassified Wolbachia]|nr:hypothetical protein [Wolbachia endosymbiont (group A) of Tiphia femorata]